MDALPPTEIVIVTAPRLPEAAGEAAYSRLAIDEASLEESIRLDDALTRAPGVSLFRRNDSAASNPTVQGLSIRASAPTGAGRALVTLDGAPQNDPFGGWVIWGALPPETISRAVILRGAGAGPYGAGALTGSVRLEERDEPGVRANVEIADMGYARLGGFAEARDENVSMMLAAQAQRSDGWIPVRAGRGAADAPLYFEGMSGVARVQLRNDARVLSVRLSGYGEERGGGLVGVDSSASGGQLSVTLAQPSGPFGWRLQAWTLASDMANSFASVAANRSTTTPASRQLSTPALGWGANTAARWSDGDSGVEIGADMRASDGETREQFSFMAGQFTRGRVAGGQTQTYGAYVEAWRDVGPYLLSGGARYDVYRAFDGRRVERLLATDALLLNIAQPDAETEAPTARLAVRRDFDGFYARSAAYAGFRPPTLNELHRPFRVGNDITEANATLEPERIVGIDFGLGGDYATWSWSAGLFLTRLEDAIVNVTVGVGPGTFPPGVFVPVGGVLRQRQNAGVIDARGVEAEAQGDLSDAFAWRAALTYADADIGGLRPAQSPEWSANAGLDWRALPATTLSLDVSYESERFEDDLNSRVLGAATTLDLRAEQRVTPRLALFAALDNALDAAVETGETADGAESFAAPRAFRIGFRFSSDR